MAKNSKVVMGTTTSDIDWFTVCRNFAHHDLTWNTATPVVRLHARDRVAVDTWCAQHSNTSIAPGSKRLQRLCQRAGYTLYFHIRKSSKSVSKWGGSGLSHYSLILEHTASGRLRWVAFLPSIFPPRMGIATHGGYITALESTHNAHILLMAHSLHQIPARILSQVRMTISSSIGAH